MSTNLAGVAPNVDARRRAAPRKRKRKPRRPKGDSDGLMTDMFTQIDSDMRNEFATYAEEDEENEGAAMDEADAKFETADATPASETRRTKALVTAQEVGTPSYMRPGAPRVIFIASILNIVVTAFLTVDEKPPYKPVRPNLIDLVRYGASLGFQLNLEVFGAAAILMCTEPTCCVLIFEKGKIVCSGCHKESDVVFAVNRILKLVRDVLVARRPSYKTLKAVNFRVRNIVGQACLPVSIDVQRMLDEEPNVTDSPIANSVKVSPPVLADVGLNRKNQQRRAGSTLVHRSGYLLVIGTRTRDELAKAFAYVQPLIQKYYAGSAEQTFSADDIRRYYTSLRYAYEESAKTPAAFVVVREDASRGTVEEWRAHLCVEENLAHYLNLVRNPMGTARAAQPRLAAADLKMLPPKRTAEEQSLVVAKRARDEKKVESKRALINRDQGQMSAVAKVRLSSDLTRHTIRKASAVHSVNTALKEISTAYQVMTVGPDQAVKDNKPKKTILMSFEDARHLYKGE
jgi:TATA-box binding protein (TBP) (component of TFIID and TFIIIB)